MVKILRKFENRGIKIARVNSILIKKLSIYSYLLCNVIYFVIGPL